MNIWVLSNAPLGDDYWLYRGLIDKKSELGIKNIYKIQSNKKASEYRKYGKLGWIMVQFSQMTLALRCIIKSKKNDIFITESYPTGRHCAVWCTILRKKRSIFALNCLQRKKSKKIKFIDGVVDFFAWKNRKFVTSVNVQSAIEKLTIPEKIKKERKIYIIPDTYLENDSKKLSEHCAKKKYDGMTGGYANRDFSLFFDVARKNRNMKFACVVGSSFKKNLYIIPDNVDMYKDVTEVEFLKLMDYSKIILLPLLDDSVAGLVVLKDAIANNQPFLISNTDAVCNYVPEELRKIVLAEIGNVDNFNSQFLKICDYEKDWKNSALKIKNYAKRWSPQNKIEMIVNILKKEQFL